jgi:hypothetical protein
MLPKLINYLKHKLKHFKNYFLWKRDLKKIMNSDYSFSRLDDNSYFNNKILIIVPHADDELIGCYKILSKYKKNVRLFYCGMSGSNQSEDNKNTRLNEFIEATKSYEVEYSYYKNNLEQELLNEVINYKPDLVLLPNFVDWHNEHREVNSLFYSVIEANSITVEKVGFYKISTPIPINQISNVFNLGKKDLNRKKSLFSKHYKSQRHMPIARYLYEDRLYGKLIGSFAGETYSIYDLESWKKRIKVLSKNNFTNEISDLHKFINDIWLKWKLIEDIEKHFKEEMYE